MVNTSHHHGSKAYNQDRSAQPFAVHGKDEAQENEHGSSIGLQQNEARGKAHNHRCPKPLSKLMESSFF